MVAGSRIERRLPSRCAARTTDARRASSTARARPRSRRRSRGRRRVRRRRGGCRRGGARRCSARIAAGIAARRDELRRTIALEAGKPIKTARSRSTAPLHVQDRGRGGEADLRRDRPARLAAGQRGPARACPPRPARPDRRDHAVQLPAQPRRAQGRAGARRGQSDRAPAGIADAGQRAASSAGSCSRRAGPRTGSRSCPSTTDDARAARRGRPDQAADVHRQPGGRLGR